MIDDKQEEFLLTRLIPEEVSSNWEKFAPIIDLSLPPTVINSRLKMANILRSILLEDLVVWLGSRNQEELFILTTQIREDKISLTKNLLIYSFTALKTLTKKEVMEGFLLLNKYAKAMKCESIIAYVENERIIKFFESINAETSYTLTQMKV